ncbi:MAG: TonB-dependent receptor [Rikenellaceae bacterium]
MCKLTFTCCVNSFVFLAVLFLGASSATAQSGGSTSSANSSANSSARSASSVPSVVRGQVTSYATGLPQQYVEVRIVGTSMTTLTDVEGFYIFENAPSGYRKLLFNGFGFAELISEPLFLTKANPVTLDVELKQALKQVSAVVVKGRTIRRTEEPPVGAKKLDIQQIEKSPGGTRDISKVVQNLPGVAATSIDRNDLIVRGGGANENRFFLDRIEIPVLNHFQTQGASGGNASIVNSDFLSSATLYTSAFPANRGNALSSVLDLRMKEGNKERFKTKFSIGASDVSLTIDTPLGDKSSLIASYRISYLQFLFSALKLPFLPTYQDAQFKYTYRPNDRSSLKIIALGSLDKNRLNTTMDDLSPSREQLLDVLPELDQWSYVLGGVYTYIFDDASLDVVVSHNRLNNNIDKWQDNDYDSLQTFKMTSNETELKSRVQYNKRLSGGFTLNTGVEFEGGWYDNNTAQVIYLDDVPYENAYSTDLSLFSYALFATVNKRFFDETLRVMLSLRMDGSDYNDITKNPLRQLSPRLAVGWQFAEKFSLSANIGRYYQEPSYTTMGYRNSEGELVNRDRVEYIGSNQVTVGVDYVPRQTERLALEIFYKGYDHYPMSLIDSTAIGSSSLDYYAVGAEPVASVGKAYSCGLELSYRNDDLWGFVLFTSYTYCVSKYAKLDEDFQPTDTYVSTNWDYRHLFNILLSIDLGKGWEIGTRWRFAGGAPYTPYDLDLSSSVSSWNTNLEPVLDYSLYNSERLEPFHQWDIRVDKTWYFDRWSLGLYLDVQNLYNYSYLEQDIYLAETDVNGNYVEDPNNPGHYILESYENSSGGTIIPTFGVIIEF